MTNRVIQSECKDSHLDEVSKELMRQASQCVTTKGEFTLALSEADDLDDFYARLMFDPDLRMFPWEKTQLWFFGEATVADSIQVALSAHSGIPQEHVHHVRDGLPEEVKIDCCISDGDDLTGFPDAFARNCSAWLILAPETPPETPPDTPPKTSPDPHLGGVTHIFVITHPAD
jgi:hypothetical protein